MRTITITVGILGISAATFWAILFFANHYSYISLFKQMYRFWF